VRSVVRVAASLFVFASLVAGCAPHSTSPDVARDVTVVVRDSLGTLVANASIVWWPEFDGFMTITTSDAQGECTQSLSRGPWLVSASSGVGVAAVRFTVTASEPGSMITLTTHTHSLATGTATLSGRTNHGGTIVTAEGLRGMAATDSAGAWTLDGIPPGTWFVRMDHAGFAPQTVSVTVPAPGSSVVVPPVTLGTGH
jgi:hypothetical protein